MHMPPIFKVPKHHNGIDLAAKRGTEVLAAFTETVIWDKMDGHMVKKL
jgi:murein DD-endopeptidase MepM/ murein hydrolase activator NlpD